MKETITKNQRSDVTQRLTISQQNNRFLLVITMFSFSVLLLVIVLFFNPLTLLSEDASDMELPETKSGILRNF